MDKKMQWITARIRLGWIFLILGIIVGLVGIIVELLTAIQPYNGNIITGLGILLSGIGIAFLLRYGPARKDADSARKITVEERDERTVILRNRAGNRAYWVSTGLIYTGLMWASFAANGDLPSLTGDLLWYFLAACVLIPFAIYAISISVDMKKY